MAGETQYNAVKLSNAGNSSRIIPGDTLLKIAGIGEAFEFKISGASDHYITIKANTTGAKTDGAVLVRGNYLRFENLEIYYSGWTTRQSAESGSFVSDLPMYEYIDVTGVGIEFYRCVVHDMTDGIQTWKVAENCKISECVIYYNGWDGVDRGHGHGIYTENENVGTKIIERSIIFYQFGLGIKALQANQGYTIKDCILFNNNLLYKKGIYTGVGLCQDVLFDLAQPLTTDIEINGCEIYRSSPDISIHAACLAPCYWVGGTGFTIINNYMIADQAINLLNGTGEPMPFSGTMEGNTFLGTVNGFSTTDFPLNTWAARPTSGKRNRVILCDVIRAHIAIYNYDLSNTVDVDCSSFLIEGDTYKLINVQDFFTDIINGTVASGGIVTVPMVGRTTSAPIGWDAPTGTFPEFGCFIIEKT